MNPAPQVLSIPASLPFAKTLAASIFNHHGNESDGLARLRILLPNRRACRTLREAFLDLSDGKPMLMPRIQPIGEWEDEEIPADILSADILHSIPPAIDRNRRLLLLARLVMQFEKKRTDGKRSYPPAQALQLARQLGRFLDDVAREGADIHALSLLAPADLAVHWQQTLDFLHIISVHWPEMLKNEAVLDPVEHRNRVLKAIASAWRQDPPDYPVIAAGSTGTQPATAQLLAAIARLPQGSVILPGLDIQMPEAEWEILSATHPQYALKGLLKHLGINRKSVGLLAEPTGELEDRLTCLRTFFQPAATTANWARSDIPLGGMKSVRLLEGDTPADESRIIALALRESLQDPNKTAALITNDRTLARRVSSQMRRFNIEIDDSAGIPLLDTPPGVFLRLIAECIASRSAPVALLALLRHPYTGAGREPAECRRLSRILDKEYLRGIRQAPGLKPLCNQSKHVHPDLYALLSALEEKIHECSEFSTRHKAVSPQALIKQHVALAEWLASTPQEDGAKRLWAGDAGNQLAQAMARLIAQMSVLPDIDSSSYPGFFDTLLADKVFRPRFGRHPRLHILSPIEARLQHYDRVILGGLNEDVWPARPPADPWMSRPMREGFGLSPLERAIGQSAHDFFQLAATPELFLTRARKADGKPTVPSRWLVRIETLLRGKDENLYRRLIDASRYEQAKTRLDAPLELSPIERPEPKPPVSARLKRIHATAIEIWQRDPYIIYAKHILALKALRKVDEEPGPADFGTLVHEALKDFSDRFPESLPSNAQEELLVSGRRAFKLLLERPAVAALWWPRFEAIAQWFLAREQERRVRDLTIITERRASWPVELDNGETFTLTTRIDRLELDSQGNATIIDYKTGALPRDSDIERGLAAQLPVEALIATQGALQPPVSGNIQVTGLEYWRLGGSEENSQVKSIGTPEETAALLENCKDMLSALIRQYANPDQPFAATTHIKLLPRYNDYEHLTRRKEWGDS